MYVCIFFKVSKNIRHLGLTLMFSHFLFNSVFIALEIVLFFLIFELFFVFFFSLRRLKNKYKIYILRIFREKI